MCGRTGRVSVIRAVS